MRWGFAPDNRKSRVGAVREPPLHPTRNFLPGDFISIRTSPQLTPQLLDAPRLANAPSRANISQARGLLDRDFVRRERESKGRGPTPLSTHWDSRVGQPLFSSTFPVRSLVFESARRRGRACPTLVVTSGNAGDGKPSPHSETPVPRSLLHFSCASDINIYFMKTKSRWSLGALL